MTQDELAILDIRLLLARYGRQRVMKALATIDRTDAGAIEAEIERYEAGTRHTRQKKVAKKRDITKLLEEARVSDESREVVRKIAHAYEGRQFLPELREAKRFLESVGSPAEKIRSRADALPKIIEALARQPRERLEKLATEAQSGARGDLGVIADQILGGGSPPSRD